MALAARQQLDGYPEGHANVPDPRDPLPALGRALFFSKQLSGGRDVACATCHHPLLGGGDGLSLSVGVAAHQSDLVGLGRILNVANDGDPKTQRMGGPNVPRNSLSTFNAGFYQRTLMYDGRISVLGIDSEGNRLFRTPESPLRSVPDAQASGDLLAVQARFPVTSFGEMRGFHEFYGLTRGEIRNQIANRLKARQDHWLRAFEIAFRRPSESDETLITYGNIARALAAYIHSQSFLDTPWARYLQGKEDTLTQQQKKGARLFLASAEQGGLGCSGCHSGDFFTDESGHVAAFPQLGRGKRADGDDPGYFLVTQDPDDLYKFRTPTLLNVTETAPWGHAGSFNSMRKLLQYHADPDSGFESFDFTFDHLTQFTSAKNPWPHARELTARALARVSTKLPGRPLTDDELDALLAFLDALTDPCLNSRECLQPWIAGLKDDFDGHLLQAVFQQHVEGADLPPFDVQVASGGVGVAVSAIPVKEPPLVEEGLLRRLAGSCLHTPERGAQGERRFVERSTELGLEHEHLVPGEMWYGREYSHVVEFAMQSAPMASGDIDGDCWPDLVFATHEDGRAVAIAYINQAGVRFERRDLNRDGLPDAIGSLGLADLDADHRLDLVVGNLFGARETAIYRGTSNERFKLHQKISMSKAVFGFAFADYSGDGWVDMFSAHWDVAARPAFAPALMQNHSGDLYPADTLAGTTGAELEQNFHFSPGFVDIDNDGNMDLLIASDFGTSEVLRNTGGGRYEVLTDHDVITDENGMGSAIGDFNNDGALDWFVTSIYKEDNVSRFNWGTSGNRLYMGSSTGFGFVDDTSRANVRDGAWGWGACAADFDNDGWLDIFAENGFGHIPAEAEGHVPDYIYTYVPLGLKDFHFDYPRLFMNQGHGVFRNEAQTWGFDQKTNGRGVVCMDFDRDGDIDVVISQNSGKPLLYENRSRGSASNGFIGFHLVGNQPNTSAVGAVVTIVAGGRKQVRHVLMNSNYQSQNPSTLHFGLGDAASVESVVVRWPDGKTETLGPIKGNQYYPLLHPLLRPLQ